MTLLWHDDEPIGICVFTTPAKSLRQRSKYFGLTGKWSRLQLQALNRQLVTLSRVVMHPTYRGAGLAAEFIRKSCELCRWPWVETLAQMGNVNPFFERAGFVRVGTVKKNFSTREKHSAIYGANRNGSKRNKGRLLSKESHEKSKYAEPVYYVFENDGRGRQAEDGDEKEG